MGRTLVRPVALPARGRPDRYRLILPLQSSPGGGPGEWWGPAAARMVRAIRPDPRSTALATKPEVPAVMSAMLREARNRKLTGMPRAPAAMVSTARIRQTVWNAEAFTSGPFRVLFPKLHLFHTPSTAG